MPNEWMRGYLTFNPETFKWAEYDSMMRVIEGGGKLTKIEQMTREYYENLAYLMVSQMDSEYVGAYGYMPITYVAPRFDPEELRHVPQIVHDEFVHGTRIKDCLELVGFNADKWIEDHQGFYNFRLESGVILETSPMRDFRVSIFYYPIVCEGDSITTWANFSIFQFLQDRGAGEQLKDAINSSFEPWSRENQKIMREENRHILHGDRWMAKLYKQNPELIQGLFDMWWPRSMVTFGHPASERNNLWRKLGLKRRTNEEVLRDFLDGPNGIHAANENVGLKITPTDLVVASWKSGYYERQA